MAALFVEFGLAGLVLLLMAAVAFRRLAAGAVPVPVREPARRASPGAGAPREG